MNKDYEDKIRDKINKHVKGVFKEMKTVYYSYEKLFVLRERAVDIVISSLGSKDDNIRLEAAKFILEFLAKFSKESFDKSLELFDKRTH
jgi:hypothetical protein